jgi:hypothetical protein
LVQALARIVVQSGSRIHGLAMTRIMRCNVAKVKIAGAASTNAFREWFVRGGPNLRLVCQPGMGNWSDNWIAVDGIRSEWLRLEAIAATERTNL